MATVDLVRHPGLEGDYTRGSADAQWQDSYILGGLVLTPTLGVRGDLYTADMSSDGYSDPYYENGFHHAIGHVRHRRPGRLRRPRHGDGGDRGALSLPDRDRARLACHRADRAADRCGRTRLRSACCRTRTPRRWSSTPAISSRSTSSRATTASRAAPAPISGCATRASPTRGYTLDAVIGQSYQLAGLNSFAQTDLALVGYDSGLETDVSDYVGSLSLTTPVGVTFGADGRFDESSFALRRTDIYGAYTASGGGVQLTYTDIAPQPVYGSLDERSQVTAAVNLKFAPNWNAFGAVGYDIQNAALIEKTFGVGYAERVLQPHRHLQRQVGPLYAGIDIDDAAGPRSGFGRSRTSRSPTTCPAILIDGTPQGRARRLAGMPGGTTMVSPKRCRTQPDIRRLRGDAPAMPFRHLVARTALAVTLGAALATGTVTLSTGPAVAASSISVVVNKQPITTYEIRQRVAFLQAQAHRRRPDEEGDGRADRRSAEEAGDPAAEGQHPGQRRRRGL